MSSCFMRDRWKNLKFQLVLVSFGRFGCQSVQRDSGKHPSLSSDSVWEKFFGGEKSNPIVTSDVNGQTKCDQACVTGHMIDLSLSYQNFSPFTCMSASLGTV